MPMSLSLENVPFETTVYINLHRLHSLFFHVGDGDDGSKRPNGAGVISPDVDLAAIDRRCHPGKQKDLELLAHTYKIPSA